MVVLFTHCRLCVEALSGPCSGVMTWLLVLGYVWTHCWSVQWAHDGAYVCVLLTVGVAPIGYCSLVLFYGRC